MKDELRDILLVQAALHSVLEIAKRLAEVEGVECQAFSYELATICDANASRIADNLQESRQSRDRKLS